MPAKPHKTRMVSKLNDKGYPYHSKYYREAHEEADKAEKKKFPKGYKKLEKEEKKLGKNELMGRNTETGRIEVEKKFKKDKKEIAYHEEKEHLALRRLEKKHEKSERHNKVPHSKLLAKKVSIKKKK